MNIKLIINLEGPLGCSLAIGNAVAIWNGSQHTHTHTQYILVVQAKIRLFLIRFCMGGIGRREAFDASMAFAQTYRSRECEVKCIYTISFWRLQFSINAYLLCHIYTRPIADTYAKWDQMEIGKIGISFSDPKTKRDLCHFGSTPCFRLLNLWTMCLIIWLRPKIFNSPARFLACCLFLSLCYRVFDSFCYARRIMSPSYNWFMFVSVRQ